MDASGRSNADDAAMGLLVRRARVSKLAFVVGAAAALLTLMSRPVHAQEESTAFQIEHFETLPNQGTNVLNVSQTDILGHLEFSAGLFFHDAEGQLVLDAGSETEIIERAIRGEISGGLGLYDWADVGFVLPVFFLQSQDLTAFGDPPDDGDTDSVAGISDPRIVAKLRLVDWRDAWGFGVAVVNTLYVPVGDDASFNSDGVFRWEPRLAVDWRHPIGFALAANLGYQLRPRRTSFQYVSDDVIRWSGALVVPTGWDPLELTGTIYGNLQTVGDGPQFGKGEAEPVDVVGSLQFNVPDNITVDLGGGVGLTEAVGAPDLRVFAGFGYEPRTRDRDGDGIEDEDDDCPYTAEDIDGHDDHDGCPEDDRDGDGIGDDEDECPDEAEDIDGYQDDDGCIDEDNDGDGIIDLEDDCRDVPGVERKNGCPFEDADGDGIEDAEDDCPNQAEDPDGFEDDDGCPDSDNDGDGVPDDRDECPTESEDVDGFLDEDGCPDRDNDHDGIVDAFDECPNEMETRNDFEDDDGCPDEAPTSKVEVTEKKIVVSEKIFFETDSARISAESHDILREIGRTLQKHPKIAKLRIEGHTDSRGSESYNKKLSQDRADSVRDFLSGQGVDPARLDAVGYGEERPISTNDTAEGREENRRVEFTIVRRR